MFLNLAVAECDGCKLRLEGDTLPEGWIQVLESGEAKIFCHRRCLVTSHAGEIVNRGAIWGLTETDVTILTYLVNGASNAQIAARVHLSHHTIKNRLWVLYAKLNVRNRFACTMMVLRLGIVDAPNTKELMGWLLYPGDTVTYRQPSRALPPPVSTRPAALLQRR